MVLTTIIVKTKEEAAQEQAQKQAQQFVTQQRNRQDATENAMKLEKYCQQYNLQFPNGDLDITKILEFTNQLIEKVQNDKQIINKSQIQQSKQLQDKITELGERLEADKSQIQQLKSENELLNIELKNIKAKQANLTFCQKFKNLFRRNTSKVAPANLPEANNQFSLTQTAQTNTRVKTKNDQLFLATRPN